MLSSLSKLSSFSCCSVSSASTETSLIAFSNGKILGSLVYSCGKGYIGSALNIAFSPLRAYLLMNSSGIYSIMFSTRPIMPKDLFRAFRFEICALNLNLASRQTNSTPIRSGLYGIFQTNSISISGVLAYSFTIRAL